MVAGKVPDASSQENDNVADNENVLNQTNERMIKEEDEPEPKTPLLVPDPISMTE